MQLYEKNGIFVEHRQAYLSKSLPPTSVGTYFICQNKTNEDRTKGDCKLNVKDLKTRDVYLICLFTTNNKRTMAEDNTTNYELNDDPFCSIGSNDSSSDSFFNTPNEDASSILDSIMNSDTPCNEGGKDETLNEGEKATNKIDVSNKKEDNNGEAEKSFALSSFFDNNIGDTNIQTDNITSLFTESRTETNGTAGLDEDPFGSSLFDDKPHTIAGIDNDNPFVDMECNSSIVDNGNPFAGIDSMPSAIDDGNPFADMECSSPSVDNGNPFAGIDGIPSGNNDGNPFTNMEVSYNINENNSRITKSPSPFDIETNISNSESQLSPTETEGNTDISVDDFLKTLS